MFFLSCVCYAFVQVCLYVPCGHLLGKGWSLSSHLWRLTVSLSLSHRYPGSGVVLNCIDSWSLTLTYFEQENIVTVGKWDRTLVCSKHFCSCKFTFILHLMFIFVECCFFLSKQCFLSTILCFKNCLSVFLYVYGINLSLEVKYVCVQLKI